MFRRRRLKRVPRGALLPIVAVVVAAMSVAGLAVAGRVAGLYPRWVVFAVAAAAGAGAGLIIRSIRRRFDAIGSSRRT